MSVLTAAGLLAISGPAFAQDDVTVEDDATQQSDDMGTEDEAIQQDDMGPEDMGTEDEAVQQTEDEAVQQSDDLGTEDESIQQQADDDAAATGVGVTETGIDEIQLGVFESPVMVTLRGGPIGFEDSTGDYTSRMSEGLNVGVNFTGDAPLRLGAETGFQYSHIGAVDSGFFGASEEGDSNAGANAFIVPLHGIAGVNLSEKFHVAAHGGASLLYRSIGQSMQLGREGDDSLEDQTDILPSVALNAGYEVSDSAAITLRGDYLPTPAEDIVVATLGLGIGF